MAKNRVIGKGNTLPWPSLKEDFKFFKERTHLGNLLMGRKTFEGMPMPFLPNRNICVLTKKNPYKWDASNYTRKGFVGYVNIIEGRNNLPSHLDYWVAGGAEIYSLFMPEISEFFVTELNNEYEGDTFMPPFEDQFKTKDMVLETLDFKIFRYGK